MAKIDWRTMMSTLSDKTEEQLAVMLDEEVEQHKRPAFVRRLHQRYAALRTMRERAELLERIGK